MDLITLDSYYFFLATNKTRTKIATGVAGDLGVRLWELENEELNNPTDSCCGIIYWETFRQAIDAINRENAIKRMSRRKKEQLVRANNPEWQILNEKIYQQTRALGLVIE